MPLPETANGSSRPGGVAGLDEEMPRGRGSWVASEALPVRGAGEPPPDVAAPGTRAARAGLARPGPLSPSLKQAAEIAILSCPHSQPSEGPQVCSDPGL